MIILKDMGLLAGKSKEEKDKISFYTKELLANGGASNSGIMYYTLKALKGFWPEAVIKTSVKASMTAVKNDRFTQNLNLTWLD
jgi:hypothetical protein